MVSLVQEADLQQLENAGRLLLDALRDLVARCDGAEGVRADGSNIQTMQAHSVLTRLSNAFGEGPRYEHDCATCQFLGRFGRSDLYYHGGGIAARTIIARYSSDGPDYQSGLSFGRTGTSPELAEAFARAKARGFNVED